MKNNGQKEGSRGSGRGGVQAHQSDQDYQEGKVIQAECQDVFEQNHQGQGHPQHDQQVFGNHG